MKLIQYREIKMLLHLVSISIFSVPITTHILKLALDETFIIYEHPFSDLESILLIVSILLIISANIISIVTDKWHKISMLLTGGFLFAVTIIQIGVFHFDIPMKVFDKDWPEYVSILETSITGTFSILLLMSSAYIKNGNFYRNELPKLKISFPDIPESINKFQKYIENLDCKLAFLLGIVCSMILAIPLCGLLYLMAYLLLGPSGDSISFLAVEKMKFLGWLGIVGMQGSIISMFLSIRRFDEKIHNKESLDLFLNSLLRPFIGLSLAHLSFFMLESGMAQDIIEFGMHQNTSLPENDNNENIGMIYTFNYHVSIAFITGFTERLAKLLQTNNRNIGRSQVNGGVKSSKEQGEKNNKTPLRRKNEHVEAI